MIARATSSANGARRPRASKARRSRVIATQRAFEARIEELKRAFPLRYRQGDGPILPQYAIDRLWQIAAWNRPAADLFELDEATLASHSQNLLAVVFDPTYRTRFRPWETLARRMRTHAVAADAAVADAQEGVNTRQHQWQVMKERNRSWPKTFLKRLRAVPRSQSMTMPAP